MRSWVVILILLGGLDLPVSDPRLAKQLAPPPGQAQTPAGPVDEPSTDPADEPPTFFGQPIPVQRENTIVYVVDGSGSMGSARLDIAKRELKQSISELSESIKFNVASFSCSLRIMWHQPKPATAANKIYGLGFADSLWAGGGTATGPAVALGLEWEPDQLVLLTDGEPNCHLNSEEHRQLIRRQNTRRVPIHVFGIHARGPYESFCRGVASDSGGSFTSVR